MAETPLHVDIFVNEMECIDSSMLEVDKYILQSITSYAVKNLLQHSPVGCMCFIWKKTKYYWEDLPISLSVDGVKVVENFRTNLESPISVPMFRLSE